MGVDEEERQELVYLYQDAKYFLERLDCFAEDTTQEPINRADFYESKEQWLASIATELREFIADFGLSRK